MEKVFDWIEINKLTLNIKKTQFMGVIFVDAGMWIMGQILWSMMGLLSDT